MALLLVVIFIIYAGLGLPDSVFGSAWPAIYPDINQPVGNASFVTVLISTGTVLASMLSAKLINKFGTGLLTAFSTALTTFSLLAYSFSDSLVFFLVLAIPLGFGAGAIDAALNNFIAVHYKPIHMCFSHSFYGVGVALTPLLMSLALSFDNNWRLGFRLVFFVMLFITIVSFLALPLWKKAKNIDKETNNEIEPVTLSFPQMIKVPALRLSWFVFFTTVGLEFVCGVWGCTFLVSAEGMTESKAAELITLYYVGMTSGRIISGFLTKKFSQQQIIYVGYSLVGVAIVILFLPLPAIVKGIALFLIGLGNGPTFPNLAYLTPSFFGKEISPSVMGSQLASCNLGILIMPPVFGIIAQYLSVKFFPLILAILFVLMLISTIIYLKMKKTCYKEFIK